MKFGLEQKDGVQIQERQKEMSYHGGSHEEVPGQQCSQTKHEKA